MVKFSTVVEKFQSTHSLRSATYCYNAETTDINVSIHALLAECDQNWEA